MLIYRSIGDTSWIALTLGESWNGAKYDWSIVKDVIPNIKLMTAEPLC
jgi:hypothetical protein